MSNDDVEIDKLDITDESIAERRAVRADHGRHRDERSEGMRGESLSIYAS